MGTAKNFYTLPVSVNKHLFVENENINSHTYRLSKKGWNFLQIHNFSICAIVRNGKINLKILEEIEHKRNLLLYNNKHFLKQEILQVKLDYMLNILLQTGCPAKFAFRLQRSSKLAKSAIFRFFSNITAELFILQ